MLSIRSFQCRPRVAILGAILALGSCLAVAPACYAEPPVLTTVVPTTVSTTVVPTTQQFCISQGEATAQVISQCPSREVVVGGAGAFSPELSNGFAQNVNLSIPTSSGDGWIGQQTLVNNSTEQICYQITVYAICVPGTATVL